ncbi:MAG TPA: DNA mismatch repair endonuclease MutL [Clostridiales bacterium]|nr:DNA mismatch repair endonuclease MutL [Clostridiales bacterium]
MNNLHEISILDNKTINKIAAGEVVERPASIVKELVENSIDAKATAVTVEIKNGGISLLRVTDNGFGISKKDVKIAFIRHATSKIKDESDLSNILSMGFRGEALASIAAISQVEIITKEHNELTGVRMQIDGGIVTEEGEVGCPEGTTMVVKNIFYNTPVRRKFLKTEMTEAAYIEEILSKMALGHPEISFKFINNSNVVFYTSGNNDLNNVIFNIYGRDITKKLLEINDYENNIRVEGFVGKPEVNRANRMYENFFINGRYIKSTAIENYVEDAFKPYMMIKRFPFCVLKINMLPDEVDVNVHPTKIEVRFKEEKKVCIAVYQAIKRVLENVSFIVDVPLNEEKELKVEINKTCIKDAFEVENYLIKENNRDTLVEKPVKVNETYYQPDFIKQNIVHENENKKEIIERKEILKNYKIVGQIFNTYWILEHEKNMYIIDQHAAHEKVLYEKFMNEFKSENIISQQLLQPMVIEVSIKEKEIILKNIELLKKFGFEIEEFGINSFAIREVPIILNKPSNAKFFLDIIDQMLVRDVNSAYQNKEQEIASIACKAAVKANDKMSFEESKKMIDDLIKLDNPFHCPHGRPVIIAMDRYEIEKKFKRVI